MSRNVYNNRIISNIMNILKNKRTTIDMQKNKFGLVCALGKIYIIWMGKYIRARGRYNLEILEEQYRYIINIHYIL